MKIDLIDVSETEKTLKVEVPSTVVDAEIARVTRKLAQTAQVPGFRPGKVPAAVILRRWKSQILSDVAEALVPRTVDEVLRARDVELVDAPRVTELSIDEGQPLVFSAALATVPPIDPGDFASITLRRPPVSVEDDEVDKALSRLRERAARFEPIEDREAQRGDTVIVDLTRRRPQPGPAQPGPAEPGAAVATEPSVPERLEDASVELGSSTNPPGFDDALLGVTPGDTKTFTSTLPSEEGAETSRDQVVEYTVAVKALRRRILPAIDDEFAKDLGEFGSLEDLRAHLRQDLHRHAEAERARAMRQELLRQLAARVTFAVPDVLVERELDRRTQEFGRRLRQQGLDPERAGIAWDAFRDEQRESAAESVRAVLVVDAIVRREQVVAEAAEVDAEIDRLVQQMPEARDQVRHHLEHERESGRLAVGIQRDKAIDLAMSRATIVDA